MVSVTEASSIVMDHPFLPEIETVPFTDAVQRVLAKSVAADRDLPPIDRVSMDGIALSFETWDNGTRSFSIEGVQAAGTPQKQLQHALNCIEVMTGAVLPAGTDTVVPYEDLEISNGVAKLSQGSPNKRQYIHAKGSDAKKGEVLLGPGIVLSPAEVALLAAVGKSNVEVFAYPPTAIVSSGDELVDVSTSPESHQVRRSNTFAIQAAMNTLGWKGSTFHLADNKDEMVTAMKKIADDFKVIILSGGVSKGKFDFVPAVLEEIGVTKVFHRVNQRPGKPFWFGVSTKGHTVFALPGNPVSTYMCFYRYIRPWFLKSVGVETEPAYATLSKDFNFNGGLTYFLQVSVKNENGRLVAHPDPGGGSGDFANLKKVTGFLELPADRSAFKAGEVFPYFPFRG